VDPVSPSAEICQADCRYNLITRQMRLGEHTARMGQKINACRLFLEWVKGRDCVEALGIDGWVILKFTLKKYRGRLWSVFMWL